jgi:hypothetical protein
VIIGLEKFKEHFTGYNNYFVLIGGTACTILFDELGIGFRATKDLDIVLCVEAISAEFSRHFWRFIEEGGYESRQKSTGDKIFYRFEKPARSDFPYILELFSRIPDDVTFSGDGTITPIPFSDEAASLSAILLDENYYQLILEGKVQIDGFSVVKASHLIALKARAWLDLSSRRDRGEGVDSRDIKKHKNDVFRLSQLLDEDFTINLPEKVKSDIKIFLEDPRIFGSDVSGLLISKKTTAEVVVNRLKKIYL